MPAVTKKYSDIDLNFIPHPVTGDITVLRDEAAVKRSLLNLMFMCSFDRPNEPELAANLRRSLHEEINPLTEKTLDMQIRGAVSRYESRVTIISLEINGDPDNNGYNVTMRYVIDAISAIATIQTFLERIR